MRWKSGRRSSNVDDRRSVRISGKAKKGGGIGILVIALVAMYFGIDPSIILQQGANLSDTTTTEQTQYKPTAQENELADFVSVVLADTEDTWDSIFRQSKARYQKPTLVMFTGSVKSACGFAKSAMGPFYCPADQKVYIDLSFYKDLKNHLGAPGDFAQAYVIAHEVGHHVQNLLGISDEVHNMHRQLSKTDYNKMSVQLELQADCFSGIWANHADKMRNILESGDLEEALNAASMIGDDRLQKQAKGHITPDSFTHGTSVQRVKWFKKGFTTGDISNCNTFKASSL